jgi:sulfite reductase alpha subunit-like flavoprotein
MEENKETVANLINFKDFSDDYHDLRILFGSQTDTAKFASEELQRELWKYGYITKLSALDYYNFLNLPEENYIIFIVSTTGHGEPPSNMRNFWQFILKKELPEDSLENINFALFKLGDSSYEKFNWVAKILYSRLKVLSAQEIDP